MGKKRIKPEDGRDPAMIKAKELFEQSGMSLPELAEKMGYDGDTARQSVWQFLNRTKDPRLKMLRKFSIAIGVSLSEIVQDAHR